MGWVYNLKDPNAPTHAPRLIAICLVFSTAAFFAVGLRFYVRYFKKGALWWDDWAALSSAVGFSRRRTQLLVWVWRTRHLLGKQVLGAAYSGIAIARKLPLTHYFPLDSRRQTD